jgi:hypothetical protein
VTGVPSYRTRSGAALLVALAPLAASRHEQSKLPQWQLSRPRLEIGRDAFELHRVCGATLLRDGRIVIADAGNLRLLVLSSSGRLVRQFGRAGPGPGEFDSIIEMAVTRDTILTWDGGLRRVTVWRDDGTLIRTIPISAERNRLAEFRAALSPGELLVTAQAIRESQSNGLFLDVLDVMRTDGRGGITARLARMPWKYTYVYREPGGGAETGYRTPFLGEAALMTVGDRIIVVPLGGTAVEVRDRQFVVRATVQFPGAAPVAGRHVVNAHRDLLIATMRRLGLWDPRSDARVRAVFGASFPLPPVLPAIEDARVVGTHSWLRAVSKTPRGTVTWYVLDPVRERFIARVELPHDWRVLGGSDRSVLVLRRDDLDTEYIEQYDLLR